MKTSIALWAMCIVVAAVPAMAQYYDIYDNGPTTYNAGSWNIGPTYPPPGPVVSDSFTVASNGIILDGFNFLAWVPPGYALASAELSITSQENGGTVYLDQTFGFFMGGCVLNNYGYDVCTMSTGFFGPILNAGTYWVNLQNGQESDGEPLYWDENSGPSLASQNQVGTIPSESFTVFAMNNTSTSSGGTVPEPGSILLLGSGLLGMAGMLRRNLF